MNRLPLTVAAFATGLLAFAFQPIAAQAGVTSLTVTSATLSKSTAALNVTGTIVCTAGDAYMIDTDVIQVLGGQSGLSEGVSAQGTCTGGVDTWVASQDTLVGSFKNGTAQVYALAIDLTDGDVQVQLVHQPVTPVP